MKELYKKDINKPDNYDGVAGHPEPDILKCKVKWAFRSTAVNKASGCDGIPVELFKTLKDAAIKMLHSACQQIWKTQEWPKDWKNWYPSQFHQTIALISQTIALISHASKVMLKILHARLHHYMNQKLQTSKLGLEKAEEPEIKLPTFAGS